MSYRMLVIVALYTLSLGCSQDIDKAKQLLDNGETESVAPEPTPKSSEKINLLQSFALWKSTAANNSLKSDPSLFVINDSSLYSLASLTNYHSHYEKEFKNFEYSGSLWISSLEGAGVGVTFLSDYNNSDNYYRLRTFNGGPFELSSHGEPGCSGVASELVPEADTEYSFKINVLDNQTKGETLINVKIWPDSTLEPAEPNLNCVDASDGRRVSGKVGVWAMGRAEKRFAKLSVSSHDLKRDDLVDIPVTTEPSLNEPSMIGFPDENNTGSRVARSDLVTQSSLILSSPGLYEGLYFSEAILISGNDITLRDCVVRGSVTITGANARLEYVEIDGVGVHDGGIGLITENAKSAPLIYRSYIHHFFDLTRPGGKGITIKESYLYDWGSPTDGNHADAMQFPVWNQALNPPHKIVLEGNTIYEPSNGSATAAMGFNSVMGQWEIIGNYMRGSGFMLYISKGGYTLKDNIFAGDFRWGSYRFFNDGRDYAVWANNRDENGDLISAP